MIPNNTLFNNCDVIDYSFKTNKTKVYTETNALQTSPLEHTLAFELSTTSVTGVTFGGWGFANLPKASTIDVGRGVGTAVEFCSIVALVGNSISIPTGGGRDSERKTAVTEMRLS